MVVEERRERRERERERDPDDDEWIASDAVGAARLVLVGR
jgi:hypothetical protein